MVVDTPLDQKSALIRTGGQRERAKDGRRRRIVQAAHDLLRREDIGSISGKTIAAHAGVSLSTVYNLFGSKDAVLEAVYADDLAAYEDKVAACASSDALERLFDAVEVAMDLYRSDADFYRAAMWRRAPGEPLDAAMRQPRGHFWQGLIVCVQSEGFLRDDTDSAAIARMLVYQFSGALSDWVAGTLSLDQFARDMAFGFAATLIPFATPTAKARLLKRLNHSGGMFP